jgi:outer membrane immunogenic protein
MKRMLIAAALAVAATSQSFAADLPPANSPPPRAPATYVPTTAPVYNWGGIYLGINGGGAFGTSAWSTAVTNRSSGDFSTDGFLVGGTVGANFQAGAFVFGVEGDLDWSTVKGTGPDSCDCQTKDSWLGTARGRLGIAADRVLFYGTGGAAFGDVQAVSTLGGSTESTTKVGWTAGAGVEVALGRYWTARAEYLYVDLGNGSCTTAANCNGLTDVSVKFTENVVRLGVDFKFGGER